MELVKRGISEGRGYRLIFLDVNMPMKDGYETVAEIRGLFKGSQQPFVVGMTGDSDERVLEACKAAGMNKIRKRKCEIEVVVKPLMRDTIVALLAELKEAGVV